MNFPTRIALLFAASLFSSTVYCFDGVLLRCEMAFSEHPAVPLAPKDLAILPSNFAVMSEPGKPIDVNNQGNIYRGEVTKENFKGVNQLGARITVNRKDGSLEIRVPGNDVQLIGQCSRRPEQYVF